MRTVITSCLLAVGIQAQVPDGAIVASSYAANIGSGSGGLFVSDPRVPGPSTPITGLPIELRGPHLSGPMGARSIGVRQSNGVLLVGEIAPPGHSVDVHEVTVAGMLATGSSPTHIGTASGSGPGSVTQIAMLPNGDALISVSGLADTPPLSGAAIGILRHDGNVFPLTALAGITGDADAVAANRAGTVGFAAVANGPNSDIYSFSLPPAGAPSLLASLPGVTSLSVTANGDLVAATSQSGGEVVRLDSVNGNILSSGWTGPFPVSIQIERPTDRAIYLLHGPSMSGTELGWIDGGGGTFALTGTITGTPSGVDVFDNPRIYGSPSSGNAEHRWQLDPTVGSLPRAGNATFALKMTSTDSNAAGGLIGSPNRDSWSFFGVEILLDANVLIPFGYVPSNGVVPFPIPPGTPIGMTLYFQSYYLDTGLPIGAGASNGLQVTIMP